MQGYREMALGAPLLTCFSGTLVALDPETGALRWSHPIPMHSYVSRVVVVGENVFVAVFDDSKPLYERDTVIHLFTLATGAPKGQLTIPFYVTAALLCGDRVYFSGTKGLVALDSEGRLLFRADLQQTETTIDMVGRDVTNREAWRLPAYRAYTSAFLALGDAVAQVDMTGEPST